MKNKILSLLLAGAMVLSMSTTPVLAAGGELTDSGTGGSITADSDLEKPEYKVVVPTTLVFAIDPFEQAGKSQVYSEDLTIINKSNVPVKIKASVAVVDKAGTDVTFQTSESAVSEADTSKNLFFAVEVAKTVTETAKAAESYTTKIYEDSNGKLDTTDAGTETEVKMTDVDYVTTTYGADTVKVPATAAKAAEVTFALAGAKYIEYHDDSADADKIAFQQMAASNAGSAAFRFSGKVNTTAAWADDEITATVTYTFTGLSGTNYSALAAKATASGSQGYIPSSVAPSLAASSYTVAASTAFDIAVDLGEGDLLASGVTNVINVTAGNIDIAGLSEFVTYANGKLSFTAAFADYIIGEGADQTFKIVFTNSVNSAATIVFSAPNN